MPLALVLFAFLAMLGSSLTPVTTLSPGGSRSATLNPALVNLFVNKTIGLGGLWWGGAQTIFGLTAVQRPLVPLSLEFASSTCALSAASVQLRTASLAAIVR